MEEAVKALRESLFQQNRQKTIEGIIDIIENMSHKINDLSQNELMQYTSLMESVGNFFAQGDFLAVSDVIKYELLPLFQEKEKKYADI